MKISQISNIKLSGSFGQVKNASQIHPTKEEIDAQLKEYIRDNYPDEYIQRYGADPEPEAEVEVEESKKSGIKSFFRNIFHK